MAVKFARSLFGYDPREVDKYIEAARREAEERVSSLSAEIERLTGVNSRLEAEIGEIQAQLDAFRKREAAVAQAIIQAQIRASSIEDEARAAIEEQKRQLVAQIAVKRAELKGIKRQMESLKTGLTQILGFVESALAVPDGSGASAVEDFLRKRDEDAASAPPGDSPDRIDS